jgi:hypothetical protein
VARQVTLEVLVGTLDEGDKVRSLGLGCASDSMARGTFPRRRASDTGVRGRERAKGRSCCEERPIRLLHRPCCGRRGDLRTTIGGSTEGAAERGGNNISVRGSVDASVHPRALTDPPGPLRQEPSVDASNTRPPNNHSTAPCISSPVYLNLLNRSPSYPSAKPADEVGGGCSVDHHGAQAQRERRHHGERGGYARVAGHRGQ